MNMYGTACPDCLKTFSRRDVMLRHRRTKHVVEKKISHAEPLSSRVLPPPPPPPPPPQRGIPSTPPPGGIPPPPPPPQGTLPQDDSLHKALPPLSPPPPRPTVLHHPFTMMVSGPTACGKTSFVRNLLQHLPSRVQPSIDRIVWLYRRWQTMYSAIQNTVTPRVEFHQGIPMDLEDDEFFDPKLNNLLILDDLQSTSGKDRRITDLFTEGSHHRSLSVISINQNLYASKDPTQRRNCHYLVLFNNPVDKQSIMTLAGQMYPGNAKQFMKSFEKATKYPYNFLLVDLKPFTPNHERLKCTVNWYDSQDIPRKEADIKCYPFSDLSPDHVTPQNGIKVEEPLEVNHSIANIRTKHIKPLEVDNSVFNSQPVHREQENSTSNIMAETNHACDDCGLLFDSTYDVQRHVKGGWCPETSEPPAKRLKKEEPAESDSENEENIEDNEGFLILWKRVKSEWKDKFDRIHQKYLDDGEDEDDAIEMAEDRIKPLEEREFLKKYGSLLEHYWLPLLKNSTHTVIVEKLKSLIAKGVNPSSAVQRILNKNRNKFEELFKTELSDKEDTEDEESDEETNSETGSSEDL